MERARGMKDKTKVLTRKKISFFDKYLSVWVILCIVAGVAVGKFLPAIPDTLSKFEYANVSIPVAVDVKSGFYKHCQCN